MCFQQNYIHLSNRILIKLTLYSLYKNYILYIKLYV